MIYVLLYCGILSLYSGEAGSPAVEQNASVYYGKSAGNGGVIRVQVEVQGDELTGITVTEHNETAGVGQLAVDAIPKRMLERQSVAVDGISGCTISSNAIVAAVSDALADAGVKLSARPVKMENEDAALQRYDVDVAVIGAGAAGLTSAIMAVEQGAQVLVLEKMPFVGGTASVAGGWVTGGNSRY